MRTFSSWMDRKASGAFLLAFFLPRYAIDVAMVADDRLVSCVAELFSLLVSGLDALKHKHSSPCNKYHDKHPAAYQ